jgi:hypothetical protein
MDDCLSEASAAFQLRNTVTNGNESEMKCRIGEIHKSRTGSRFMVVEFESFLIQLEELFCVGRRFD